MAVFPVEPFDLVIFGGTGDLALRKLLPALLQRFLAGQMPGTSRVIGVARDAMNAEEYRTRVRPALSQAHGGEAPSESDIERFLALLDYRRLDAARDEGWTELAEHLLRADGKRVRVFYLATSPELFAALCARLKRYGLADADERVVIEKPIGRDLATARAINDAVGAAFPERRIFRIDHYLGKETVQNLVALRFANALFEPVWMSQHVDHVQITVAENIGVERRGPYYDKAGALRDMVQNHLLQLLCLVAMEPPAALDADAIRDEKLKVLRALKPITSLNAEQLTVRGQYRAGASAGQAVPGYLDESGDSASRTETFVAIKAEVANWRWAGVPFYLRTGKRLPQRVSEIVVTFRAVPHSIFAPASGTVAPNKLVLRLQPDEGVTLLLMAKTPGPGGLRLQRVPLDMSFANVFGTRQPEAYERLLMDVVRGDPTLFMRRDEVEAAWRWIDPILSAWAESSSAPKPYTAGSWGPSAAVALIERDGRTWHEESA